MPKLAAFDTHVQWFETFAKQLGWPEDDPALQQLQADLAGWADRERQIAEANVETPRVSRPTRRVGGIGESATFDPRPWPGMCIAGRLRRWSSL